MYQRFIYLVYIFCYWFAFLRFLCSHLTVFWTRQSSSHCKLRFHFTTRYSSFALPRSSVSIHTHTHIHTYMYVHIYTYIYIHAYMHTCARVSQSKISVGNNQLAAAHFLPPIYYQVTAAIATWQLVGSWESWRHSTLHIHMYGYVAGKNRYHKYY